MDEQAQDAPEVSPIQAGAYVDTPTSYRQLDPSDPRYQEIIPIQSESLGWHVVYVNADEVVFHENIRQFDAEHVLSLAASIQIQGQIAPVIGDLIIDKDGNIRIRIIAGQHRTLAVREANYARRLAGEEEILLAVRLIDRTLLPQEILEIQLAENDVHPMTPAEVAIAIQHNWEYYIKVYGPNARLADFAPRVGRSQRVVREALKFATLDERVKALVLDGHISYTLAVGLSALPKEKPWEHQFNEANRIILGNMNPKAATKRIKHLTAILRGTERHIDPDLFGLDEVAQFGNHETGAMSLFKEAEIIELKEQDYILNMRNTFGASTRDAVAYYKRVLGLCQHLDHEQKEAFTAAVVDLLRELVNASEKFRTDLLRVYPKEYAELFYGGYQAHVYEI